MEAGRPVADEVVLELLANRELRRGDVYETREGVCRLGPELARELAEPSRDMRDALVPHAARTTRIGSASSAPAESMSAVVP